MTEETKVTEESVREALRGVLDPELHLDVVTLGLIREINVDASPANLKMLLTTPFCPYGPWMVQQVKETAWASSNTPRPGAGPRRKILGEASAIGS
ncbi:MAG: iron-sulfur cluster assembly protein [Anaerolineae bacterium]